MVLFFDDVSEFVLASARALRAIFILRALALAFANIKRKVFAELLRFDFAQRYL